MRESVRATSSARSAVAEAHDGILAELPAERVDRGVGQVPDHHRVGAVAELVVAHHHAEALDHPLGQQFAQALDDPRLVDLEPGGQFGVGRRDQRQTLFDHGKQPALEQRQLEVRRQLRYQVHCSLKPRSMKYSSSIGRSMTSRPVPSAMVSSTPSRCARSLAVTTNQRLKWCSRA